MEKQAAHRASLETENLMPTPFVTIRNRAPRMPAGWLPSGPNRLAARFSAGFAYGHVKNWGVVNRPDSCYNENWRMQRSHLFPTAYNGLTR